MRILWVGTKPPWPPIDGGRLIAATTLQALAAAGSRLTLVAPFDPSRDDAGRAAESLHEWVEPILVPAAPRSWLRAAVVSVPGRRPVSVVKHTLEAVRGRVGALLAETAFDVVHAEQPQALPQCRDAAARGLPVILRAQNVESDLWAASAAGRHAAGLLARIEAKRMARFEGEAVRAAAATIALSAADAERLRALSGTPAKVHHVPAPFPASLPAADGPLPGAPAAVLVGSGGWLPNRRGAEWFVGTAWPEVLRALPGAILHVFGDAWGGREAPGVRRYPAPADSRQAFAPGAVLIVPVPFGSGVRMKVLEAWARGLPVVATPPAAEGLEAEDGRELLLARTAGEFAAALRRLTDDPRLAASLAAAGRARLVAGHDPARAAARLLAVYEGCLARPIP
jgi:hypothetical protein